MKSLSRAIDRFCYKHPRFGISRLMLFIVILSAFVYLVATGNLYNALLFHPGAIMQGQIWRLITWVFLPTNTSGGISGILFTAIALYFYYFIGSTLEREWGTGKFTIYYLFGVVLHIIYGFIIYYAYGDIVFLNMLRTGGFTSMYLNLSMFFAFAVLFPDFTVRLFLIIPIKIKWLALLNAAFFLYSMITNLIAGYYPTALLPLVALLNFILMCGDELLVYIRPFMKKASPQVINFKKEAKRVKRDMKDKPYRHKCAVCGRTELDSPELEFRYCSLCNGYHCYCSQHINNHIHFT